MVCLKEFVARTDWWKWGRWGGREPGSWERRRRPRDLRASTLNSGNDVRRVLRTNNVLTDHVLVKNMREVLALSMQRHVQLFAHCTCSARTVHAQCTHTARAFSTSGSTILTAQSTCLPHTTIQRTNHSLLFSSAEHSQCSVWVKCYPGPFREAINCYVESTLLGSKALLYSSLLHRLAF